MKKRIWCPRHRCWHSKNSNSDCLKMIGLELRLREENK